MTFRLGIDVMVRKEGIYIYIYMNTHVYLCVCVYIYMYIYTYTQYRQIQGCEVNECLSLESTKPKSTLNKVQSVYSDFLDNLCVSVCCV